MTAVLDREVNVTCDVKAGDLVRVLSNAMLGAGTDDTLPVLRCVKVSVQTGILKAEATDRYVVATDYCKIDYTGYSPEFSILLDRDHIKRIIGVVKASNEAPVTLAMYGDDLLVSSYEDPHGTMYRPYTDGQFPAIDRLMPSGDRVSEDLQRISFDRHRIALFSKVDGGQGSKTTPMIIDFGESNVKPVKVTVGASFVALLMPVRMSG